MKYRRKEEEKVTSKSFVDFFSEIVLYTHPRGCTFIVVIINLALPTTSYYTTIYMNVYMCVYMYVYT